MSKMSGEALPGIKMHAPCPESKQCFSLKTLLDINMVEMK